MLRDSLSGPDKEIDAHVGPVLARALREAGSMLNLAPEAIEWIAARTTLASPLQAIPLIFRSIEHLLVVMSRSSRSTFRPWEGQVK
ncbi:hypothetical protein CEG14_13360 [Bordetella genomosp. 1]|uniref:Uncharacterized protein n=1 Tax=Bordetella genomosp. 1 TaxID=1395607 RepID=A0A261SGW4_9BORD|nr:hypothetical protein CEG14_13360 [Bordetella genomosp. 1]